MIRKWVLPTLKGIALILVFASLLGAWSLAAEIGSPWPLLWPLVVFGAFVGQTVFRNVP